MKTSSLFSIFCGLLVGPVTALAQVTIVPPPLPGVNVEVRAQVPGIQVRRVDTEVVRRHLSIPPKVIVVPEAIPAPPPPAGSTTTTTTTTVETARPRRIYNRERNVVTVVEEKQAYELPYVAVPVLFVKETAELLDQESRKALDDMAGVIREIAAQDPNALFDIEGHTSTDGTTEFNLSLSAARAQRVFDELTQTYQVPARVLSAHGYGESYPNFPNGTEEQMQLDRRVLVVRKK